MTTFLQAHLLTAYPPSNLNRDDLGRPKTAVFGNQQRLRISSQSLKRAWRTSSVFKEALEGSIGVRTRLIGTRFRGMLTDRGVAEDLAESWAVAVAGVFGDPDKGKPGQTRQIAHITPAEERALDVLAERIVSGDAPDPTSKTFNKELDGLALGPDNRTLLGADHSAADVAMFGRMLAADPLHNVEAAVQVAHAITVNRADVEEDYFSAVDDLNVRDVDAGAAHIGEAEFGSGLFYLYACIDCDQLLANLGAESERARRALAALLECMCTVSPTGKQNSFASRAYASYVLLERGHKQPRTLAVSFLDPVRGSKGLLDEGIERLKMTRSAVDEAYGPCAEATRELNTSAGQGTLSDLLAFGRESIG